VKDLITIGQIELDGQEVNSVNSRDIHKELGLNSDFSTWIKKQLELFVEDVDYITLTKKVERQILIEYILTLDTAKHIAMIQRNEKGMEIRQRFIDYENNNKPKTLTKLETLKLAIESEEKYQAQLGVNKLLVNKIDTISEKAKALTDEISNLDEARTHYAGEDQSILIGEFAKSIFDFKALRIGPNNIFKVLNDMGYLFKRNNKWLPHQRFQDQDLFVVRPVTYDHPHTGKPQVTTQTEITTKGIETLPAKIIAFVKEERKRIYG